MEGKGGEVARARKDNPRRKIFDWISESRLDNITPFQKFILDVDWEKSPLGPMTHWPPTLHQMVLLIIQDPSPAGKSSVITLNVILLVLRFSKVIWSELIVPEFALEELPG